MTGGELTVYLVRHGRTALNADGRLRGLIDPPLDGVGHAQADSLAVAFSHLPTMPVRIVTSPLERARQTATAIALASSATLVTDQRLIDRDYGPWAGRPAEEVMARWGADLDPLPHAEPLADVAARALEALDDSRRRADGPVVLVSHDAVLSALLVALDPALGRPSGLTLETGSWSRLALDGGDGRRWRVVRIGADAAVLGEAS